MSCGPPEYAPPGSDPAATVPTLGLDHQAVLFKYPQVERMYVFHRHVQIEVAGNRQTSASPGRHRRGGVRDHQPGVGGKMDGQRSGERQMHFKVTQPLEPFRRAKSELAG